MHFYFFTWCIPAVGTLPNNQIQETLVSMEIPFTSNNTEKCSINTKHFLFSGGKIKKKTNSFLCMDRNVMLIQINTATGIKNYYLKRSVKHSFVCFRNTTTAATDAVTVSTLL